MIKENKYTLMYIFPIWIMCILTISCEDKEDIDNSNNFEYMSYADNHWDLEKWINNTLYTELSNNWEVDLYGTHFLHIQLNDSLREIYGDSIKTSLLGTQFPDWITTEELSVIRDSIFYYHIAKYDQFVGGWDDCYDSLNQKGWYKMINELDTVEYKIMTPNKETYIEMLDISIIDW